MNKERETHDLNLPRFGPYTKLYSGISHIPKANDGVRFDLAVFPGLYRRRVDVPDVRFESGYHMWKTSPDLECYTVRYELEWKDAVYADVSFVPFDDTARLIRAECRNNTDSMQNLVLHYMASAHDPTPSYSNESILGCEIHLPPKAVLRMALDYESLKRRVPRPNDGLCWDGLRRGEEAVKGFVNGYGIGGGFGCASSGGASADGAGDMVRYCFELPERLEHPCLCVRYQNQGDQVGCYTLSTGETLCLPPCEGIAIAQTALNSPLDSGKFELALTSCGTGQAKLDCLVLCEQQDIERIDIHPRNDGHRPEIYPNEQEGWLVLKYPHIEEYYGIVWDFGSFELRQIENDELDIFLRHTVHDHVSSVLKGNGKGHFTNVFFRPIPLKEHSSAVLYGALCCAATREQAEQKCRELLREKASFEKVWEREKQRLKPFSYLPAGEKYAFGQQLMQAVLCSNVVYPVYTRGSYIRHNTPGRWWDCLYTWDSGFIGMGLSVFSIQRGFDCLNAYLTPPGDEQAAFIHHGSLVPTQFYLFAELLNKTRNVKLLESCYPRLLQYYRFYTGQTGGSTTGNLHSGLLRPWDYFYNSGGWDDYPPQKAVHEKRLEQVCAPVITTAHAVRCAKILSYAAGLLNLNEDAEWLLEDAKRFTQALQQYSWDETEGYFGYVLHDETKNPCGILKSADGTNFNKGLGGASPLIAGACTESQRTELWKKLQDPDRLWCGCGLSTVDQSASYYRKDGYWNGAVWMPYQWLFFKAALDDGKGDFAFQVADTALSLWQEECALSYHCFEHFMIESHRGAGWHQFGGLSAPVVQWFESYYRPGTVTTGFNTFVRKAEFSQDLTCAELVLDCTEAKRCTILVVTQPGAEQIECSTAVIDVNRRYPGLWEITVEPARPGEVRIRLK